MYTGDRVKKCENCGAENDDGASFCALCFSPVPVSEWHDDQGSYHAPGEISPEAQTVETLTFRPRENPLKRMAIRSLWIVVPVLLVVLVFFIVKLVNRIPAPVASSTAASVIDLMSEPLQTTVSDQTTPIYRGNQGGVITPIASYSISAKVLRVRVNLHFRDEGFSLFPIDVSLAWGKVAESDYNKYLSVSIEDFRIAQNTLEFQIDEEKVPAGLTFDYICDHLSNNHVCPSDQNVYNAVANLGRGQTVRLDGYLVTADYPGRGSQSSSLSRTDTGDHACEIFFVNRVQVEGKVFE